MKTVDKIKLIINELRPFLNNDGGDIEFIEYKDNIVYVKMVGACAECGMVDFTLNSMIEEALKDEIPEIESVVNLV